MNKLQPQLKEKRKIAIPAELREIMREVYARIKEAKADPDIKLDYDDAIQIGPLYGGRCGAKPRPYWFWYSPQGDKTNGRWKLHLALLEIEDIAEGMTQEMTMYCCTNPKCGAMFNVADEYCGCDYVPDPDFNTFVFPIAAEKMSQRGITGINENSTKNDIISLLGNPDKQGGGKKESFGYIEPWITYIRPDCHLRFGFHKSGKIKDFTVLKPDWDKGSRYRKKD